MPADTQKLHVSRRRLVLIGTSAAPSYTIIGIGVSKRKELSRAGCANVSF